MCWHTAQACKAKPCKKPGVVLYKIMYAHMVCDMAAAWHSGVGGRKGAMGLEQRRPLLLLS